MRVSAGGKGAVLLALIVCISVLTTMNAAIFTGARTSWALGRDFRLLRMLGDWRAPRPAPADAPPPPGALTPPPVGAGAPTPAGLHAMVACTSPRFLTLLYPLST